LTAKRRGRHFAIAINLSRGMAHFFDPDADCPATLRGTGVVNFRRHAARWTVALPAVFNGRLEAIAVGRRTWMKAGALFASKRARWIELQRRGDYRALDRFPLLRDIVVMTNPLRSLQLLRSVRGSARAAASATKPRSITASCANKAKEVTKDGSADTKHLTDQWSVGGSITADEVKSWQKTKISAEADATGVCQEKVSLENANAEGFDVVFDFTYSTPKQTDIKQPAPTGTYDWKTIYHVKQAPCLEGTWKVSFSRPTPLFPGTYTISATAAIAGDRILWSRDYSGAWIDETSVPITEPPYFEQVPETVTSQSDFDGAQGILVGWMQKGTGNYTAQVVGPQLDRNQTTTGLNTEETNILTRPLAATLNCAAGLLTVTQFRTITVGPPLIQTLHKTADGVPHITVEEDWRTQISAPIGP
jgi:hypothetical protein